MNQAIRKSVALISKATRAEAGSHRRTGSMRRKIRYRVTGRGLDTVGRVLTGRGTNLIVGGVRAHPITSSNPMPLWAGRGKSATIEGFASAVQHPGFAADPFMDRAVKRSVPSVIGLLDAAGQEIVSALASSMR